MSTKSEKVTHNIEYEDAPSGHVTFYNYKEPLMKFEGGFGFVGALVFDGVSEKVQCHLCGRWFDAINSNHLRGEHAMTAEEYKKIVGLNKSTALINEKMRSKLIATGLDKRMQNLRQNHFKAGSSGYRHSQETIEKIRATLKENRDEMKNLRGTCPEQLIDRLQKLHEKLGRTPTHDEIPFIDAINRVYGGMKRASELAGIPYRTSGENMSYTDRTKHTREALVKEIRAYHDKNKKLPSMYVMGKRKYGAIKKHGYKSLCKEALSSDGVYRKVPMFQYTKTELLEFLRMFEKINGRKPSYSDCKRGLLPHLSRYTYNFGGWKKALDMAFNSN